MSHEEVNNLLDLFFNSSQLGLFKDNIISKVNSYINFVENDNNDEIYYSGLSVIRVADKIYLKVFPFRNYKDDVFLIYADEININIKTYDYIYKFIVNRLHRYKLFYRNRDTKMFIYSILGNTIEIE